MFHSLYMKNLSQLYDYAILHLSTKWTCISFHSRGDTNVYANNTSWSIVVKPLKEECHYEQSNLIMF